LRFVLFSFSVVDSFCWRLLFRFTQIVGLGVEAGCLLADRTRSASSASSASSSRTAATTAASAAPFPLVDSFLPKRMAFAFDVAPCMDVAVDERRAVALPPKIVMRARADCPPRQVRKENREEGGAEVRKIIWGKNLSCSDFSAAERENLQRSDIFLHFSSSLLSTFFLVKSICPFRTMEM
jgi:hypothetical protein